jgi:hypothetical protein
MKQIEIDCVKEFAEKMREFGYGVSVGVTAKPAYDYKPPMHDTEIKVVCFKRTESNDALFWDDLILSSQLCILQKPGNTAFTEKARTQEGQENPWKKD